MFRAVIKSQKIKIKNSHEAKLLQPITSGPKHNNTELNGNPVD